MWIAYRTPLRYGSKFQGWQTRPIAPNGVPVLEDDEQFMNENGLPTVYAPIDYDD
jgi:hypothetical protein